MFAEGVVHIRGHGAAELRELVFVHGRDLTDTVGRAARGEFFEIHVENFLRCFSGEFTAGFEHLLRVSLNVLDAGDGSERFGGFLIHRCAGRRTEREGVGQDRGAEPAGCRSVRCESFFFKAEVNDGGGTADRHRAEPDRFGRLNVSDFVMIQYFENTGVADIVDGLSDFVVVNENEILSRGTVEVFRYRQSEVFQNKGCFRIEFACSGRLGAVCVKRVLKSGIADGRTDRVGVRVFMSDNVSHPDPPVMK